jgi:predicted metal-dependent phosphoesterase TrpH
VSKIDLHIHTNFSDGRYSPAEIVKQSAACGLTLIAITDHDTVAGITPALEAAWAFPRLKVIPGVEISTETKRGETHILGYFINYTDQNLQAILERMRNSRLYRAQSMVAKLRNLGVNIDWERVQEIAGKGAVGRPHIAQAMLEKEYITSFQEAFSKYIGRDGPAYAEREKITPVEAVHLIIKAKGIPVLAHPATVYNPEVTVVELKEIGLAGIETFYKDYTTEEINELVAMARKYDLITTGGSDYHGVDAATEVALGSLFVPDLVGEQLLTLAEKNGLQVPGQ